jgi:hypothetical protein
MQGEMWHGRLLLAALVAVLSTFGVAVAADAGQDVVGAQLPDLVQEAPRDLGVVTATTAKGPRFRLGFRSAVHNKGTGPLLLDASRPSTEQLNMTASQVVRHDDGRTTVRPGVGQLRYTKAAGHTHWHLLGFEVYELRSVDGRLARPSQKTGFCIGDRYDVDFFEDWPNEPPTSIWRQQCGLNRPELLRLRGGMSVGWGDDYDPQLEGQYIDVTGLPAGRYDLVHRVNVDGALLESDYTNNVACRGVQLSWPRGAAKRPSFRSITCSTPQTHTEVGS